MENFSTPRGALLPQATNLVTVAVLVAATWWSGAQRPVEAPARAAQAVPQTGAAAQPQRQAGELALASPAANWPAQATTVARDGLQAVGYQPRTTR